MIEPDHQTIEAHAGARIALIADSFHRVTGGHLAAAEDLWGLPGVVVAHGTQADPLFFYGNRKALDLFEISAQQFIALPSRLSAEAPERGERERLLAQVSAHNFIADYAGVRVSATGTRFRIEQAVVWNLLDGEGQFHGQAAWFDRWVML